MQLMTFDNAFAITYALALVLAVTTALTDLAENSLTLAAIATVTQNQTLDAQVLVILFWLGHRTRSRSARRVTLSVTACE